jgi:pantoate kinase
MTDGEPVRAFVPGHVTGLFSVHPHEDPRRAGSRGAGCCLSAGVTVSVRPDRSGEVVLGGRAVELEAAMRVLDTLGVEAGVCAETALPVSAGFGVSGATALGTALTANTRFELARTENELVGIAHAAEVAAGTGLGDVVAQARGGVPIRLEPGAPAHGELDCIPARGRIEHVTFGELSTADVLGGSTRDLSRAGERALSTVLDGPTFERLLAASRTFADEADLLTPPVQEAIDAVGAAGGEAAMAMLGDTVVARGTGLSDAGYDAATCTIDPTGATLL